MSEIEDVRLEFVQLWARLGPFWGIAPATARVHAWLLSSPAGLDGEAIAAELEMSRGAVSMACRELVDWGLAQPQRAPGSRRVVYVPETEIEKAMRSIIATRKRREWDPLLESLRSWNARLRSDRSTRAKELRERLESVEGVVGLVDSMAQSFLEGGLLPRLGLKALATSARLRSRSSRKT